VKLAALAVLLLAGCSTPPTEMRVILEPAMYSASMSSRLGITLTAVAESPPGMKVHYVWKCDAGYFLLENEYTREITDLGRETKTTDPKVLWSYSTAEDAAKQHRAIAITVITENSKNNRAVARTDMTLVWDGDSVRAVH
jgi:hypothetical protein